jgi:hypothetical protein
LSTFAGSNFNNAARTTAVALLVASVTNDLRAHRGARQLKNAQDNKASADVHHPIMA